MTDMTFYFCPFKPNFRIYFLILLLTWGAWCGEADDDLEWGPQWRVEPARHGDTGLHNSFPGFRMLIIPFVTGNISRYHTKSTWYLVWECWKWCKKPIFRSSQWTPTTGNQYPGASLFLPSSWGMRWHDCDLACPAWPVPPVFPQFTALPDSSHCSKATRKWVSLRPGHCQEYFPINTFLFPARNSSPLSPRKCQEMEGYFLFVSNQEK